MRSNSQGSSKVSLNFFTRILRERESGLLKEVSGVFINFTIMGM